MRFIADLHLHSRYSRATSREMEVESLAHWARKKGISLLGTGDFTHPTYFAELQAKLTPAEPGLYRLKNGEQGVRFILQVEVCNIYQEGKRLRKIHTLLYAPSLQAAERLNAAFSRRGNLLADGRPTFGFSVKELCRIVFDVSPDSVVVPAHAWTPWFSIFGSQSGFDSLQEAFDGYSDRIFALETGLSSDPPMNWRVSALDGITLMSNSDAHSLSRLGRECNVFADALDYWELWEAVRTRDQRRFLYTVEFFPEEGKYHLDGHRNCGVRTSPAETRAYGQRCPVCRGQLTVGVLHRVEELADGPPGRIPAGAVPFKRLVPLQEIIAVTIGQGVGTLAVRREYDRLVAARGGEFAILLELGKEELASFVPPMILEAILRVREERVTITPGFDGVYGTISIFEDQPVGTMSPSQTRQMHLF
ncbi:MAG: DNA helicase UvrD [candidate division NC10 bacterium]|nr:DNA helicase UvrD [candidate division NC10 bacterium]